MKTLKSTLLFEKVGIDIMTVLEAAKSKYNFQVHYAGPGVGGPCLPVNSYQMINLAKKMGFDTLKSVETAIDGFKAGLIEPLALQGAELVKSLVHITGQLNEIESNNHPNRMEYEFVVNEITALKGAGDLKIITYNIFKSLLFLQCLIIAS